MKPDFTFGEKFLIAGPLIIISISGAVWQLVKGPTAAPLSVVKAVQSPEEVRSTHEHPETEPSENLQPEIQPSATPLPDDEPSKTLRRGRVLQIPAVGARTFEFSPDGQRLAVFVSDLAKPLVHFGAVYDLESGAKLCDLVIPVSVGEKKNLHFSPPQYLGVFPPVWSPDGTSIAATTSNYNSDRKIAVWDAKSGALKGEYPAQFFYFSNYGSDFRSPLQFSDDGKAISTDTNPSQMLDLTTGKIVINHEYMRKRATGEIRRPDNVSNEDQLGTNRVQEYDENYDTKRFAIVDARTRKSLWEPDVRGAVTSQWYGDILGVSENAYYKPKAVGGAARKAARLLLWNGKTRQQLPSPPILAQAALSQFVFNPDKRTIAYFNRKYTKAQGQPDKWGELILWDYRENRVVWRTETEANLRHIQLSPNGQWVMALGNRQLNSTPDSSFHLFAFDHTGKLRMERATSSQFYRWSPDGQQLAYPMLDESQPSSRQSKYIEVQSFEG